MTTAIEPFRKTLYNAHDQLQALVPKHLTADRMIKLALLAVGRNAKLLECTPMSVLKSVIVAGELGLDFSGTMGQGYLVPFKGECTFIPGYRGLADLARRHSGIEIETGCVFRTDGWKWMEGTSPCLEHEPRGDRDDDGDITHAYAIARFQDGRVKFEVMTRAQIEKIRHMSKQPTGMLWLKSYHEAARKTVSRRLCKNLPMSPELSRAVELADQEFDLQQVDVSLKAGSDGRSRTLALTEKLKEAASAEPEPSGPMADEKAEGHPLVDAPWGDAATEDRQTGEEPVSQEADKDPCDGDLAEEDAQTGLTAKRKDILLGMCLADTGCEVPLGKAAIEKFLKRGRHTDAKLADDGIWSELIKPKGQRYDWKGLVHTLDAVEA